MTGTSDQSQTLVTLADEWYKGRSTVGGITARLTGDDVPVRTDSLMAVYPDDTCWIYSYAPDPPPEDAVTLLRQVHPLIKRLRVPSERLIYQRAQWSRQYRGQTPSKAALMRIATGLATATNLPQAMLAFGRTLEGGHLHVVLQTHMVAPLDMVLDDLKLRARILG